MKFIHVLVSLILRFPTFLGSFSPAPLSCWSIASGKEMFRILNRVQSWVLFVSFFFQFGASTDHCFLFLFQLVAGTLWAVAQTAWFIANNALGQPVAFPIITTGPGIIANLWSIFFFKEIRGRNNLLKLVGAFAVTFVGILLIALSKFQL